MSTILPSHPPASRKGARLWAGFGPSADRGRGVGNTFLGKLEILVKQFGFRGHVRFGDRDAFVADVLVILREQSFVGDVAGEPLQAPHIPLEDARVEGPLHADNFFTVLIIASRSRVELGLEAPSVRTRRSRQDRRRATT